ncbi:MAG: ARMT1-like domain-containing protein, partial [Candidatus Omnitrophota bacterium]
VLWKYIERGVEDLRSNKAAVAAIHLSDDVEGAGRIAFVEVVSGKIAILKGLAARAPPFDQGSEASRSFQVFVNDILRFASSRSALSSIAFFGTSPSDLARFLYIIQEAGIDLDRDYENEIETVITGILRIRATKEKILAAFLYRFHAPLSRESLSRFVDTDYEVPFTVGERANKPLFLPEAERLPLRDWVASAVKGEMAKLKGAGLVYPSCEEMILNQYGARVSDLAFLALYLRAENDQRLMDLIPNHAFQDYLLRIMSLFIHGSPYLCFDLNPLAHPERAFNVKIGKVVSSILPRLKRLSLKEALSYSLAAGALGLDLKSAISAASLLSDEGFIKFSSGAESHRQRVNRMYLQLKERAQRPWAIDFWPEFEREIVRSAEPCILVCLHDDYAETMFDLLFLQKLLKLNPALTVVSMPRAYQYGNDASYEDVVEAINMSCLEDLASRWPWLGALTDLQRKIASARVIKLPSRPLSPKPDFLKTPVFRSLRRYIKEGRFILLPEIGPTAGVVEPLKLSQEALDWIMKSKALFVKGARSYEMMQGIKKVAYFGYMVCREFSEAVTGIDSAKGYSVFIKQEAGVPSFRGFKQRHTRTIGLFDTGKKGQVALMTAREYAEAIRKVYTRDVPGWEHCPIPICQGGDYRGLTFCCKYDCPDRNRALEEIGLSPQEFIRIKDGFSKEMQWDAGPEKGLCWGSLSYCCLRMRRGCEDRDAFIRERYAGSETECLREYFKRKRLLARLLLEAAHNKALVRPCIEDLENESRGADGGILSRASGNTIKVLPNLARHGRLYFIADACHIRHNRHLLIYNADAHPDTWAPRNELEAVRYGPGGCVDIDACWGWWLQHRRRADIVSIPSYLSPDGTGKLEHNWNTPATRAAIITKARQAKARKWEQWLTVDFDSYSLKARFGLQTKPIYHMGPEEVRGELTAMAWFFAEHGILPSVIVPCESRDYLAVTSHMANRYCAMVRQTIIEVFGEVADVDNVWQEGHGIFADGGRTMECRVFLLLPEKIELHCALLAVERELPLEIKVDRRQDIIGQLRAAEQTIAALSARARDAASVDDSVDQLLREFRRILARRQDIQANRWLVITSEDIACFGAAQGNVAIVSLYDMFWHGACDSWKVTMRCTHELGHTLGLSHCGREACVMHPIPQSVRLCSACRKKIAMYESQKADGGRESSERTSPPRRNIFENPREYRELILDKVRLTPLHEYRGRHLIGVLLNYKCRAGCDHCCFKELRNRYSDEQEVLIKRDNLARLLQFINSVRPGHVLLSGMGEIFEHPEAVYTIAEHIHTAVLVAITNGAWAKDKAECDKIIRRLHDAASRNPHHPRLIVRVSLDAWHQEKLGFELILNIIRTFEKNYGAMSGFELQFRSVIGDETLSDLYGDLKITRTQNITRSLQELTGDYASSGMTVKPYFKETCLTLESGYSFTIDFLPLYDSDLKAPVLIPGTVTKNSEAYDREMETLYAGKPAVALNTNGAEGLDLTIAPDGTISLWQGECPDNKANILYDSLYLVQQKFFSDPITLAFIEKGSSYREAIINEVNPRAVLRAKAMGIREIVGSTMYEEDKTRLYLSLRILQDYIQEERIRLEDLPEAIRGFAVLNRDTLIDLYHRSDYSIIDQYLSLPKVRTKNLVRLYELITRGHYDVTA